ncbi:MAG: phosphatase PAP2 family protein [Candidatus Lokiarchaeota archaeon]|nr:phosphatase PAP2 family protein [Candidatus Lokiarchaeota archaeon]
MLENLKKSFISKLLLIIIIVWVILALVFGFTDLEISIAVVDESSEWGIFGRDYGEVPSYALIAIALATFLGSFNDNLKLQKIPAFISVIVGVLFIIFGEDETGLYTGLSIIIPMIFYVIVTWNVDWKNFRTLAGIIPLLAIINPLVLSELIKLLWGRVRFRDLASGFVDYTPWFLPQGITGNKSFPSGHTAMGWMFLPLLITVKDRKNTDAVKILAYILILGWGLFVGLSRIVVGAHYASDVLFSTGFAAITTLLLYRNYYLNKK